MEHDVLLNEAEAARFLRVGTKALQAWRLRGNGPVFLKVGRLVRYAEKDLNLFLKKARRQSTSDAGRI